METELYDKDQKCENEIKRYASKEKIMSVHNADLLESIQSQQREIRDLKRNEESWPE